MSFELVYTSARRGLRTGASGFCTVAATDGIPRALQDKLESLSGYRHTEAAYGYAPPINYSHLTVRIQRQIYHVVSRIGDAGIDSTGRTNKIAHHLALSTSELEQFPDGPAPLFCDDGYWFETWNSEPELLDPNRLPGSRGQTVSGFDAWESVFGDAGWAGILGHAIADGMQSVSVIVPNTNDTLALLNEALQLVPREDRWKVCFSTYYSRHVSGMQCHWRFVLDGTSEARKLRARVQGLMVDPSGSSGRIPDDNTFVKAARAGRPQLAFEVKPRRTKRRAIPVRDAEHDSDPYEAAAKRRSRFTAHDSDEDGEEAQTPGSGERRRRPSSKPQVPKMEARSPFDIPEEEFARTNLDSDDDSEADDSEAGVTVRRKPRPRRTGLILVMVLSLALFGILVYFGIQKLR
ncbi:MAG: hypothetical protein R3C59_22445 [Planctomycetaceae bacterium]